MNKSLISVTILASLFSTSSFASSHLSEKQNYDGWRIGAGVSSVSLDAQSSLELEDGKDYYGNAYKHTDKASYSDALKIELGYEFNRVIGINAFLQTGSQATTNNKYTYNPQPSTPTTDALEMNHEMSTIGAELELGYTFGKATGWNVKPYGAVGYSATKIKTDSTYSTNGVETSTESDWDKESGVVYSAGARLVTPIGIYFDLRKSKTDYLDLSETTLSVGYKF